MKKGQALMEFLMTYGWAILVVLVAIGALAYFGVLNPERFLPKTEFTKEECYEKICNSINNQDYDIAYTYLDYKLIMCENPQFTPEYRVGIAVSKNFNYTTCRW